jgi:hypothetical protein
LTVTIRDPLSLSIQFTDFAFSRKPISPSYEEKNWFPANYQRHLMDTPLLIPSSRMIPPSLAAA